ncbi:MAG: hypothetical protein ACFE8O_01680 [Candidatus Hermodarchaeota archaeon]
MNEKESEKDMKKLEDELRTFATIHDLPKRYFELMNSGSELAKKGDFAQAAEEFIEARKEVTGIIRQLLEMPKEPRAQMWQFFGLLWAFKLIKPVFYWLLAQSEITDTFEERKALLMAAVGAQAVGTDLILAFENLHQSFKGEDLELLPMLGEAIRNFEYRQQVLEKALEQQGIQFKL